MNTIDIHIPQGGVLKLLPGEAAYLANVFMNSGIGIGNIDFNQDIVCFPKSYVGYVNMPTRKIFIDSKHSGIDLSHIIRIYFFLYASDSNDLDDPIYDVDLGQSYDVVKNFVRELEIITRKGLPVEYRESRENLMFLRGNIDIVNTLMNRSLGKREIFDCSYDGLSHNIPINQVLLKAFLKAKQIFDADTLGIFEKYFYDVDEVKDIPKVSLTTNTMYCKKALSLAFMILNDLSIADIGNQSYGQNLLINFDRVFEEFIKKILTVYSDDYNFSYWNEKKSYAIYNSEGMENYKSYIPDLLYGYQDKELPFSAYAILDMKNKTSEPFTNADVYQMHFYANQLYSKKIILCYPSCEQKSVAVLRFENDSFNVKKMHAAYINISGKTSKEFKENINEFIKTIKNIL